jgi:NAD(P)-dependent dehydrogenase (short-subunit alcohol dehydrogenase family)
MEYRVAVTTRVHEGTPAEAVGVIRTHEAAHPRERIDERREQLRTSLPIGRVVGPGDIAALAVHLMGNTAVTGATFDIDGGQQLVNA